MRLDLGPRVPWCKAALVKRLRIALVKGQTLALVMPLRWSGGIWLWRHPGAARFLPVRLLVPRACDGRLCCCTAYTTQWRRDDCGRWVGIRRGIGKGNLFNVCLDDESLHSGLSGKGVGLRSSLP